MAKSAATLLTLAADTMVLTTSAQLGPVDPQVLHPERKGVFFPANSIGEAVQRVEATKDPTVKMAMADKLDPFWIGAYAAAIEICEQYLEQALEGWHGVTPDAKEKIKQAFMVRYKAHGYPIDCKILTEIGVPHVMADEDAEQVLAGC